MFHRLCLRGPVAAILSAAVFVVPTTAQQHPSAAATLARTQQRGIDYLLSKQRDGTFQHDGKPQLGITALALAAVLTKPSAQRTERERAYIKAASTWLLAQQNDDGSFGEAITNYQTSAASLALARLGGEPAKAALKKAAEYLLKVQNAESNGVPATHHDHGGFGYGPGSRGDLSNTQFAIEALRAAGLPGDHEAFARAIAFLQRTQNLRSVNDYKGETADPDSGNKHPVASGNDGGAVYFPGNSKFGFDVVTDGVRVPRSYGSMTYALLKTYALCGLGPDDERMQAATRWIRRNFTLDENPGNHAGLDANARYQGLFYYYETMARALTVCGVEKVETLGDAPQQVVWRDALAKHLAGLQRDDGSWLNERNGRWWEDQPVMCTIYALLALGDCQQGKSH